MMTERQKAYNEQVLGLLREWNAQQNEYSLRVIDLLQQLEKSLTSKLRSVSADDWMRLNYIAIQQELNTLMEEFKARYGVVTMEALRDATKAGSALVMEPLRSNLNLSLIPGEMSVFRPAFVDPYIRQAWNLSASLITAATAETSQNIMNMIILGITTGEPQEKIINGIIGELNGERLGFKTLNRRAWAIFRTETSRLHSLATRLQMEGAKEIIPGVRKQWFHGGRTGAGQEAREGHVALDEKTVPMDEPFTTFRSKYPDENVQLDYPHDPKAPADEVINCGCAMSVYMPDDDFLERETLVTV